MIGSTLTVTQVNRFIKSLIEGDGRLSDIHIAGEISNFTDHYKSGHLYFSLKDDKSVIKAVMFASAARRLKFRPANGMKVIIRGRVSVYEPTGQYQLYAEDMQPDGIGALAMAFEQLKEKLSAEGLFDPAKKRPLPPYPEKIGVITSPTGAALQDILQIIGRRWPAAEVLLCPVLVQGNLAAGQLKAALEALNRDASCSVIIIGRGGGSMEELWPFNDESLARAVAASQIPVVSAVGHETDFTICDFAADLRAPTPSAAAELCTPSRFEELPNLLAYNQYFREAAGRTVEYLRQSVDILVQDSPLRAPDSFFSLQKTRLAGLAGRLPAAYGSMLDKRRRELALAAGKLDALSPLKVLARGYSVIYDGQGRAVRDLTELPAGTLVELQAEKGKRRAELLEEEGEKAEETET